jgi:CTP synthase
VAEDAVVQSIDVPTIYEVPLKMKEEKLDVTILKKFGIPIGNEPDLADWNDFLTRHKNPKSEIQVGLVGKYVELHDAYKSIAESFIHAGAANECRVNLKYIHSEDINHRNAKEMLEGLDGILVAPGFGHRGISGKIEAARYARENNIPFFGICLGMQIAVVEFARNVLGMAGADSTEMNEVTKYPVIDLMEEQKSVTNMGGTMRLGIYNCKIKKDSKLYNAYKKELITERHRHRYEFNDKYLDAFTKAGFKPVGTNPESNLVEAMELDGHPWFIGVQYHPEYSSTVLKPSPLFVDFVRACKEIKQKV